MIRKIFRWTAIFFAGVVLLAVLFYGIVYWQTEAARQQVFKVQVQPISIPQDSASLAQGYHLAQIKGCIECHGEDLGGKVILNDPMLGVMLGSNLTKGLGGLPQNYSTTDWMRALKHGIHQDNTPLLFMPSHETAILTEADMAALIAYCQQLQPVDRTMPEPDLKPMLRVLAFLDVFPLIPAENIDHHRPLLKSMETAVSVAYGKYLSISCTGCHGDHMKGMEAPAPGMPARPDITSKGNPGKWTEAQFIHTLRTGRTPEGKQLRQQDMPWQMTAQYTDVELKSLYKYLKSL